MLRSGSILRRSRAPLALAAALVVSGCQVDVDGARCETSLDCPDGQACGNDWHCSARALACAASRCTPGDGYCENGGDSAAIICTAADPVCGSWVRDDCKGRAMVCGSRSGPDRAACECPPDKQGSTLFADPGGSPLPQEFPFPNGQEWPRECRFGRLSDALTVASNAPEAITIQLEAEGGATVAFGTNTVELDWPLLVTSNVRLVGTPGSTVIRGAAGAPAVLSVDGSAQDVLVEAESATTTGVVVTAPGAQLVRVDVAGAAGAALLIDADPAGTTVHVLGGSYGASEFGIWIRRGNVEIAPDPAHATGAVASENPGSTVVAGNTKHGVLVDPKGPNGVVHGVMKGLAIHGNGGTGLVFIGLDQSSQLEVTSCDIDSNGSGGSAMQYGPADSPRHAGGAFVWLPSIAGFELHGNRLWSNAFDQLGFETDASWSISAASCGPASNVFACIPGVCQSTKDPDACAVGLEGGGSVQVENEVWPDVYSYNYIMDPSVVVPTSSCDKSVPAVQAVVPQIPACP